jgi:hypothetical protein
MRPKLSFANVVSLLALFIALGGTSYALVVTGKTVKDRSLTAKDIKKSSLTGTEIKDKSLKAADFAAGQLPGGAAGAQGAQGPQGVQGPTGPIGPTGAKGETGTPDTSQFFTKVESDGRFAKRSSFGDSKMCVGLEFQSLGNVNTTTDYAGNGGIYRTGGTGYLECFPDLPEGAAVTNVTYYYRDNSASNLTFAVGVYHPSVPSFDYVESAASAGADPALRTTSVPVDPPVVIDNTSERFFLEFSTSEATSIHTVYGARVDYNP